MILGKLLDPAHHAGRGHPQELGGAVHRQAAHIQQDRHDLELKRHPARRRVGEVQPAALAAVALLAAHEPVLDLLLAATTLASQSHRPNPSSQLMPTDMGYLCACKTLRQKWE